MKQLLGYVWVMAVLAGSSSYLFADVDNQKQGGNPVTSVVFAPVSFVQLVALDMPCGFFSMFNAEKATVDKYEKRLRSRDWKERYKTVKELGTKKDKSLYPLLIKELTDNQVIVSIRAFEELKKANPPDVIPLLIKNLESRDPWTRKLTLDLLGEFRDPSVTQQCVFLANDENSEVMFSSIRALEKISEEPLLFQYFPRGANTTPQENILNWWYTRGKIIKKIYEQEQ